MSVDPIHNDPAPFQATATHQFLRLLRRVERFAPPDLVFHQAQRIETLCRHARQHVPFYAERLRPVFDRDDVLDLSRWRDVPILSPAEARANADRMRAGEVPSLAGPVLDDRTSGTSGEPFRFKRSNAARSADAANSLRIFIDHRFDADARFADIRSDPSGRSPAPNGSLRPSWSFGQGKGDYALLDINSALPDQVDWLLRMRPAVLFTWANNARAIALHVEEIGRRLTLTSIATGAEVQTPAVRSDCLRVFGLDPIDILGAREVGIVAWRCHASPLYHLTAETTFIEVVRDEGDPAAPGEIGRLVATPFYNLHMPFIRYATGDYVTLAARSCPCGRSLPTLSAVQGRGRNRLRLKDGRLIFPEIPETALDALIGPLQWRLVQEAPDVIVAVVQPASRARADAVIADIARAIEGAFGKGFRMELETARAPIAGARRRKHELFRSPAASDAAAAGS
jgi:phenylacetate-CoA ligase